MPFQSEKQRRYLWANEPEIARDWTDTYGSGIAKALGGRIPFQTGKEVHPPLDPYMDSESFPNYKAERGNEYEEYPYENWDPRKYIYPAMNWAGQQLTGIPFVGSAINFLGNAFQPNQVDIMNRGIVNQLGGMDSQTGRDPFGTNVVSMFGDYQQRQEDIENFYNNLDQDRLKRLMNIGWHKKRRNWATDYLKKNPIYQDWRRELGGNPDIVDLTPRRIPPVPTVIHHTGGDNVAGGQQGRPDRGRSRGAGETGQISGGHHFNIGGLAALWQR
jgi:hypothetical protein